ncbi:MAG TPA: N-acetyltransferase [Solirubrobacterales bacterium]|nr:N-acetyltransferase [Solirubrobacterales bacterium]
MATAIRRCGPEDVELIAGLGASTFRQTYAADVDAEELGRHLADAFAAEAVKGELSNSESTLYVAEVDGEPAGFVKLNVGAAQTEQPNEGGLEIESLYVARAFQGLGIGRLLLDRALADAAAAGAEYVWLGVWERNRKAHAFWSHVGFVEYGSHPFTFGRIEHTDLLMRRELD